MTARSNQAFAAERKKPRPLKSGIPQGASRLEECRVAGYPADRLFLRREAPCEPIVRPADFPA
jgi:hypothetical protein